ncbi:MAG: hypothetical protein ABI210_00610 [Abditibacteriaceae bacterium]
MANSQKPENENLASTGGVPSPPLPKIPSPAIPDIESAPDKNKYAKKRASPADSFQLSNSQTKAQAKEDTTANAPTSHKAVPHLTPHTPGDNSPQNTGKRTEASTTPSPQSPPKPHKVAPQLASHGPANKPVPTLIETPKLQQALEQRPLSIEEREKLDNISPISGWQKLLEFLQPIAMWLVRVSIMFAAASSVFLILNFFHGNLSSNSPLANSGDFLHSVSLASLTLEVSAVTLACCLMLLWLDATAVALSILAIGLMLHFGTPLLLFNEIGRTEATGIITLPLRQAGLVMIVLGLVKYAVDVVFWISTLPERMQARADIGVAQKAEPAQRRVAQNANAFSPCWKLPFCREVIRKQCPAYLARKTCWKFGRGCYCDEEMISRIIRGESLTTIKAPTRMSRKGKPPCGRCYIYLEHQSHKFRLFSPLTVPVTVIAVYFLWPFYTKLFTGFSSYLDKFWDLISFNPHNLATGVLKADSPQDYKNLTAMNPEQVTHVALIIFGVLLGFMLLIYISKFIEWVIYTAKW